MNETSQQLPSHQMGKGNGIVNTSVAMSWPWRTQRCIRPRRHQKQDLIFLAIAIRREGDRVRKIVNHEIIRRLSPRLRLYNGDGVFLLRISG